MKCAGHMSGMGEWEGTYRILVGKPAGNRPLGRHTRVQKDNINPLNTELNPICQ